MLFVDHDLFFGGQAVNDRNLGGWYRSWPARRAHPGLGFVRSRWVLLSLLDAWLFVPDHVPADDQDAHSDHRQEGHARHVKDQTWLRPPSSPTQPARICQNAAKLEAIIRVICAAK